MRCSILLAAFAFLGMTLMPTTNAEPILPGTACNFCVGLFRSMGCLSAETPVCHLLALKFKIVLDGNRLCDQFLCGGGYGVPSDGHQCKGQLQCLITKRRTSGICPIGQICCAP